ncbi:uncharacterized protein LOC101737005 isoform X2 [Bombyx mori]|uniref:uncharacterized protein LOC101737005 isoform X2 n=1 Tax=Bombyx mori TaxID=7091 RepID=UPI002ED12C1E
MLTTLLLLSCAFFSASGEKGPERDTPPTGLLFHSMFGDESDFCEIVDVQKSSIACQDSSLPSIVTVTLGSDKSGPIFFSWDIEQFLFNFELYCSRISINGQYEISGPAVTTEEKGKYTINTKSYKLMTNTTFELVQTVGNKTVFHVKNFNAKVSPLEKVALHFTNLYNGQEIPSAKFLTQEHWRNIIYTLQDNFATICFRNLFLALNKLFTTLPLEEYLEL